MKVFLDIDGVMVHANPYKLVEIDELDGFYKFIPEAITSLNIIDNAEIILTTSHRYRFSLDEWRKIFLHRGIKFISINIIDNKGINRMSEINEYIKIKKIDYKDLIIIDDDKSLNDLNFELKQRLCLTSSYVGLINPSCIIDIIK